MITDIELGIFDSLSDKSVIIQQVNCKGILAQGLPTRINKRFPGWYDDYRKYCLWFAHGHEDEIMGTFHRYEASPNLIICSVFGQLAPVKSSIQTTDIDAWHRACAKIRRQTEYVNSKYNADWKLHIQADIGCRDGHADPDEMREMFEDNFEDSSAELFIHTY